MALTLLTTEQSTTRLGWAQLAQKVLEEKRLWFIVVNWSYRNEMIREG